MKTFNELLFHTLSLGFWAKKKKTHNNFKWTYKYDVDCKLFLFLFCYMTGYVLIWFLFKSCYISRCPMMILLNFCWGWWNVNIFKNIHTYVLMFFMIKKKLYSLMICVAFIENVYWSINSPDYDSSYVFTFSQYISK